MITKILNAIDDQEQSGKSVDAAIDIARATSSTLVFFMANPAVLPGRGALFYRYTMDFIGDYFDQARRRASFGGVYDVKCITKNCIDITRSILAEAEKEHVDYIVLGSDRRRGRLANWKYSISQAVAASAPCPTIIVHSEVSRKPVLSKLIAAE
ncbi:MAG TPA: universal stress protein [Aestuariivirga sp.]|nr:universal stress protein [Aestuariivirga sp.]